MQATLAISPEGAPCFTSGVYPPECRRHAVSTRFGYEGELVGPLDPLPSGR